MMQRNMKAKRIVRDQTLEDKTESTIGIGLTVLVCSLTYTTETLTSSLKSISIVHSLFQALRSNKIKTDLWLKWLLFEIKRQRTFNSILSIPSCRLLFFDFSFPLLINWQLIDSFSLNSTQHNTERIWRKHWKF